MRPSQQEVLGALRASLNDTIVPAITDRWATYVATAMDLVMQHLERRLETESSVLDTDNADMVETFAGLVTVAAREGAASNGAAATAWESLATTLTPSITSEDAHVANEELRTLLVDAMRWADDQSVTVGAASADQVRDTCLLLVRRHMDRLAPLVEPLYMNFGPVSSS